MKPRVKYFLYHKVITGSTLNGKEKEFKQRPKIDTKTRQLFITILHLKVGALMNLLTFRLFQVYEALNLISET